MSDGELASLGLLAIAGLVAGWINTVAGAGSLLALPALVFTGLDPASANATNRISILATSVAAVVRYRRGGRVLTRGEATLTGVAMLGAGLGAYLATLLEPSHIRVAIVIAMAVMLPLSFVRPAKAKDDEAPVPVPAPSASVALVFFGIGVFGGFIQAGVGVLLILYLSIVHRTNLVVANVLKSSLILGLTLVALAVFAIRGPTIDLLRGLVLASGSAVGGWLGARSTLERGEKLVRAGVVAAVVASMAKLVWDAMTSG